MTYDLDVSLPHGLISFNFVSELFWKMGIATRPGTKVSNLDLSKTKSVDQVWFAGHFSDQYLEHLR